MTSEIPTEHLTAQITQQSFLDSNVLTTWCARYMTELRQGAQNTRSLTGEEMIGVWNTEDSHENRTQEVKTQEVTVLLPIWPQTRTSSSPKRWKDIMLFLSLPLPL